jgi:magnesium transporter
MLNILRRGALGFEPPGFALPGPGVGWRPPEDVIWLDLLNPTREEELAVEEALRVELPTADEVAQIEPSSRLYQDNGATFMTASLVSASTDNGPTAKPVTFVLCHGVLVTIRYADHRAFALFGERAPGAGVASGASAMLGLLDAVIERLAQILDQTGDSVEESSTAIFRRPESKQFERLLTDLARAQSVTSVIRTSLVSLGRLLSFATLAQEISTDSDCSAHLKSLQTDAQSLTEHASFQSSHISFLLDAALGLINIDQNSIIKFFSVAAVIFMPPTLVASIYGMNFHHMPELSWEFGYPMAICLMVLSAVVPILWFRHRGWL